MLGFSGIERLDAADDGRQDLEDVLIETKAIIITRIGASKKNRPEDASFFNSSANYATGNHNRLPLLKLPKFDGKYGDYMKFITTFTSMVVKVKSTL
ncbi:uncharacterized protein LOC108030270 isoform X2 [Drosophila biarmipes]|uniref:uncharacterized protein LOC108030270 isoform X2 n=1 Tax=Drosophila biarmipes TaxID=125945 RepID=UPI0021CC5817|nr:uncharacterized protein LOC108030270 isoform X2 [Drosophila biarmipes]